MWAIESISSEIREPSPRKSGRPPRRLIAMAALLLAVSAASCGPGSNSSNPSASLQPPPLPVALDCQGDTASVRPSTLILACGDGTISATDLTWSRWTSTSATGRGQLTIRQCSPSCAQGSVEKYSLNVVLSDAMSYAGKRYFTTMWLAFPATSPVAGRSTSCPLSDPRREGGCGSIPSAHPTPT